MEVGQTTFSAYPQRLLPGGSDYFLVVFYSHTKRIEVQHLNSITTEKTKNKLRLLFAQHGLPQKVGRIISQNLFQMSLMSLCAKMASNPL